MSEVTGRLESWTVHQSSHGQYVIYGFVYDDVEERFADEDWIHTSGIKESDHPVAELKAGDIVKTRNSSYLLGKQFLTKSQTG